MLSHDHGKFNSNSDLCNTTLFNLTNMKYFIMLMLYNNFTLFHYTFNSL